MENKQSELRFEGEKLEKTTALAKKQLEDTRQNNEKDRSDILLEKQELCREYTPFYRGSQKT